MVMQESGEMYLETIYRLSQSLPVVRSIDVSEYIGYSKPSVSRAIGILKKQEYITVDKVGAITLITPSTVSEQPVSVSRIGISIAAAAARMDFFIPMLLSFLLKYHNPLFLSICVM